MIITSDLCYDLKERMSQGQSDVEVAAAWKMSKQTLRNLIKDPRNLELREAFEAGLTAYEAYFEIIGKEIMLGQHEKAKDNVWKQFMQTKFKWSDKSEVKEVTATTSMSDDEINDYIKIALEKRKNLGNVQ